MNVGEFVNHNSYGIGAALLVLLVASWALRRRTARSIALLALASVVLGIPPVALRSSQSNLIELDQAAAAGQPAVLWLHSDL